MRCHLRGDRGGGPPAWWIPCAVTCVVTDMFGHLRGTTTAVTCVVAAEADHLRGGRRWTTCVVDPICAVTCVVTDMFGHLRGGPLPLSPAW